MFSVIKAILIFTLIVLPPAIVIGYIGARIRLKIEGHKREDLIVKASMLVMSAIAIVTMVQCFGK